MPFSPLRLVRTIMTSVTQETAPALAAAAAGLTQKRVPIPSRGVDYRGKIVLAPMVRSGELPSRLLALHYGADLVWGPETIDRAMIGTTRRINSRTGCVEWTRVPTNNVKKELFDESVIYRIDPVREAGRHIFQIGTSDPTRAVECAKLVAADVSGIDVNAGCPKPFSTHAGMGAALLRTPDKLVSILEALVAEIKPAFDIGISVKIRLLETPAETEALVRRLCATGITGLTIHCRTTPMRPRERAIRGQLRMIADVCHEYGVACVVNGDVEGRDHALELMAEYGTDGAMIATCAEKNGSCFRAKADGGLATWEEAVAKYVRFAMEVENKFHNTKFMLTQMVPGKSPKYRELTPCKSYGKIVEVLGLTGDEELVEMARRTDELMKLVTVDGSSTSSGNDKSKVETAGDEKKKNDLTNDVAQQENLKRKREDGDEEAEKQQPPPSTRINVSEAVEAAATAAASAVEQQSSQPVAAAVAAS
ncbi:tRNA-dihydrouridine synthase 2 [Neurospora sp. IMI 360204]|nr:tRNA-dihydrouridine synthase 2 [Neurospora sp. IMI 360204]